MVRAVIERSQSLVSICDLVGFLRLWSNTNQSQLGKERVHFIVSFHVTVHHRARLGQERGGKDCSRGHGETLLAGLPQAHSQLSTFIIPARTTCPAVVLPSGLGLPPSTSIEKVPHRCSQGPIWKRKGLSGDFLFPGVSSLCVVNQCSQESILRYQGNAK